MVSDTAPGNGSRLGLSSWQSIKHRERIVKKQQMRWSRHTGQRFLDVRIHVLN
jgi:hypothetical protein